MLLVRGVEVPVVLRLFLPFRQSVELDVGSMKDSRVTRLTCIIHPIKSSVRRIGVRSRPPGPHKTTSSSSSFPPRMLLC